MGLRTPSKIILAKGFVGQPYYVRYVTHGGAIKYSSMIKRLNSKGMFAPQGFNSVTFKGIIGSDSLMNFPNINRGWEFDVLKSLPEVIINGMRMDINRLKSEGKIPDGVALSLFLYKFNKVR